MFSFTCMAFKYSIENTPSADIMENKKDFTCKILKKQELYKILKRKL